MILSSAYYFQKFAADVLPFMVTCSHETDLTVFDCAEPGEVLKTVTSLYLFTKGLDCVWLCWTRWGSEDCDQPVPVHKRTWLCLTVLNQVRFWRLWPACTCSQTDLTVFDCAEPGEVLKTVTSLYTFTNWLDCVWLCWTRWGSEDCDQPVHVHKLTWLCLTVLNQVRFWRLWPACTRSQTDLTVFDCAEPGEVLKTVTSLYTFTNWLDCVWLCWTRWGSEDCDQPVHVHKLTWLCLTVLNQVRFWRLWPACTCSQTDLIDCVWLCWTRWGSEDCDQPVHVHKRGTPATAWRGSALHAAHNVWGGTELVCALLLSLSVDRRKLNNYGSWRICLFAFPVDMGSATFIWLVCRLFVFGQILCCFRICECVCVHVCTWN